VQAAATPAVLVVAVAIMVEIEPLKSRI